MDSGRRDFFKAIGTAAATAAAVSPILQPAESAAAIADGYAAAYVHTLMLGGSPAGVLRSFDGGEVVGVVVKEPVDQFGVVPKHIGSTTIEDIAISVYIGAMQQPLFDWIAQFLNRDPQLRSGSVVSADSRFAPKEQLDFTDARISELVLPELGLSKASVDFDLRLSPQSVVSKPASGPIPPKQISSKGVYNIANFRVTIIGVDAIATSHIASVDAITVRQNAAPPETALTASASVDVEPLDIGPITLTVLERYAQPIFDWHRNFIQGSTNETVMFIEYLAADRKSTFMTLMFQGVGIVRASRQQEDSRVAVQRFVKVELYAERVSLHQGPPPTA